MTYEESLKEFTPNVVVSLSNEEIANYNSLNVEQIQEFLLKQKRGNGRFHLSNYVNRRGQTGAEIIYLAGQYWRINPKILLTTIQKETSLIAFSTDNAREFFRRMDKALGFGWLDSGKVLTLYKGFDLQVFYASRLFRLSLDYYNKAKTKHPNSDIIIKVDFGQEVINCKNPLVYALYKYTPHISAQKLFWTLWKQYFE